MYRDPIKVLVVDDLGDLRDMVCLHITELGYQCESVDTGGDALAVLDWWNPVVVVIEWSLRDGSAVGLSQKIRDWANDRYRPLLIVMYSHQPESEAARETYDRYIFKPGTLRELETAIVEFLANGN